MQASQSYQTSPYSPGSQEPCEVVLTTCCRIPGCQFREREGAASHDKGRHDQAVDDQNGAPLDDTEEQSRRDTGPAVADIETGSNDVEHGERPRRFVSHSVAVVG